jgi:hypothetical protein
VGDGRGAGVVSGRQLSLAALPVADPRATARAVREKRLAQLLRMVVKAQGEDDFWEDHIATFELASRVGRPLPSVALDMAELRRRGVVKSATRARALGPTDGLASPCCRLASMDTTDDTPRLLPRPR